MVTLTATRYPRPRFLMKDAIYPIQGHCGYSIKIYCRQNHEELIHIVFTETINNGNGKFELVKSPVFRIAGSNLNEVRAAFRGISESDIWNIVNRGKCPENDKFRIA